MGHQRKWDTNENGTQTKVSRAKSAQLKSSITLVGINIFTKKLDILVDQVLGKSKIFWFGRIRPPRWIFGTSKVAHQKDADVETHVMTRHEASTYLSMLI